MLGKPYLATRSQTAERLTGYGWAQELLLELAQSIQLYRLGFLVAQPYTPILCKTRLLSF